MNKLFTILLALGFVFLFSCEKSEDDFNGVKVKYYNNTGHDIENLVIGDVSIGDLKKDASTNYINYETFGFDTGMPDENCTGVIGLDTINSYSIFYWCGTEKIRVDTGTFEMNVDLIEIEEERYFRLDQIF